MPKPTAQPAVNWDEVPDSSQQQTATSGIDWDSVPDQTGNATIGPREGNPVANWLSDAEDDIRHGGTKTLPGRVLHKMGAPGLEQGSQAQVGDIMGGPLIGVPEFAHGLVESGASSNPDVRTRDINEMFHGAAHTLAPLATTSPELIPTLSTYGPLGAGAQKAASFAGATPDQAELAGNLVMTGAGPTMEKTGDLMQKYSKPLGKAVGYGTAIAETAKTRNPLWLLTGAPRATKLAGDLIDTGGNVLSKVGGTITPSIENPFGPSAEAPVDQYQPPAPLQLGRGALITPPPEGSIPPTPGEGVPASPGGESPLIRTTGGKIAGRRPNLPKVSDVPKAPPNAAGIVEQVGEQPQPTDLIQQGAQAFREGQQSDADTQLRAIWDRMEQREREYFGQPEILPKSPWEREETPEESAAMDQYARQWYNEHNPIGGQVEEPSIESTQRALESGRQEANQEADEQERQAREEAGLPSPTDRQDLINTKGYQEQGRESIERGEQGAQDIRNKGQSTQETKELFPWAQHPYGPMNVSVGGGAPDEFEDFKRDLESREPQESDPVNIPPEFRGKPAQETNLADTVFKFFGVKGGDESPINGQPLDNWRDLVDHVLDNLKGSIDGGWLKGKSLNKELDRLQKLKSQIDSAGTNHEGLDNFLNEQKPTQSTGKPPSSAQILDMHRYLLDNGYEKAELSRLTPDEVKEAYGNLRSRNNAEKLGLNGDYSGNEPPREEQPEGFYASDGTLWGSKEDRDEYESEGFEAFRRGGDNDLIKGAESLQGYGEHPRYIPSNEPISTTLGELLSRSGMSDKKIQDTWKNMGPEDKSQAEELAKGNQVQELNRMFNSKNPLKGRKKK